MDFHLRKLTLLLGDAVLLFVALALTLIVGYWGEVSPLLFFDHVFAFSFLYVIWIVIFYILDLYDLSLPPTSTPFASRFLIALLALFLTGVLFFYGFAFTDIAPKTNLFFHVVFFGLLSYFWRLIFCAKLSALIPWRIGLCSLGQDAQELKEAIVALKPHGYECVILEDSLGSFAQQIKVQNLDTIVLPVSWFSQTDRLQLFYECLGTGIVFLDLPQAYEIFLRKIPLATVDQQWFIRHVHERGQGFYYRSKRLFDFLIALTILIVTLPLWLLIALAIKWEDRGTVFYMQERVGKNRSSFFIKKFRTMKSDAESYGAQWATKEDDRVTKIGRLLRQTHLDELPQMINVLRGDISLVGPRPERQYFIEQLERQIPHYHVRHFVQPGFTGWAQIKFRYARSIMDSQHKFEYDLYYMKNRSFVLDFLILLKTIQLVFRKEK